MMSLAYSCTGLFPATTQFFQPQCAWKCSPPVGAQDGGLPEGAERTRQGKKGAQEEQRQTCSPLGRASLSGQNLGSEILCSAQNSEGYFVPPAARQLQLWVTFYDSCMQSAFLPSCQGGKPGSLPDSPPFQILLWIGASLGIPKTSGTVADHNDNSETLVHSHLISYRSSSALTNQYHPALLSCNYLDYLFGLIFCLHLNLII